MSTHDLVLLKVGTSNTITQVELVVLASIGHHNVTMDSETQQTMIKSRWEKKQYDKIITT